MMSKYPKTVKNKILTLKELLKKVKSLRSGKKKIAICHGTFDIVHPGHIRHLIYAREKADIVIASVTADQYVVKSQDGPFIPEELRARNLAFLEIVDLVTIDNNKKPLKLLAKVKPNFFVKGFEYSLNKIHPNTREEIKVLKKFGGELLFSPADVVYSSTAIKNISKPNIAKEKFISIMDSENISFGKIIKVLNSFKNKKIHVVGDTIVDKYNFCTILGQTTKTPTFSIKKLSEETYIGGAGIVAQHLSKLGAKVTFTSIIGNDDLGKFVQKEIKKSGIKFNYIIDKSRNTTLKERYWANKYKLIQVNTVDNHIPSKEIINSIGNKISKTEVDGIIFSDFRHGIFNVESIKFFSKKIKKKIIKIADSQVSNRWGNIVDFKNFDLILPNEKEARFSLADQDSPVRILGSKLIKEAKAKHLILKMGDKGIMVFREKGVYPREFFPIDSFVDNVIDGIGAGDAMLAASSLALISSKNILISSILGNIAAAILCEQEGNVPITAEKIKRRIKILEQSNSY